MFRGVVVFSEIHSRLRGRPLLCSAAPPHTDHLGATPGASPTTMGQKFAGAARATLAVYEGLPPGAVPLTASGIQTGHRIRAPLPGSTDIAPRPIIRSTACVCEREDDDVLGCDLVRNRERKAIEDGHPPVWPVAPLRRRVGELKDQRERCFDLILQLGPETGLARFALVHLPIDLGNREPVDSKFHRRARAARRRRTCVLYSSTVIVSAMPASTSAPRRAISTSHPSAAPGWASASRLRINSSASRARSSGEDGGFRRACRRQT